MGQMLKKVLTHSVVVTFSDQERLATLCAMAKGALPTNFIGILDRLLDKGDNAVIFGLQKREY